MSAALRSASFYVQNGHDGGGALPELSRVMLLQSAAAEGGEIVSARSVGTIVSVLGGGIAYEVEFMSPVEALVTVAATMVRLA